MRGKVTQRNKETSIDFYFVMLEDPPSARHNYYKMSAKETAKKAFTSHVWLVNICLVSCAIDQLCCAVLYNSILLAKENVLQHNEINTDTR